MNLIQALTCLLIPCVYCSLSVDLTDAEFDKTCFYWGSNFDISQHKNGLNSIKGANEVLRPPLRMKCMIRELLRYFDDGSSNLLDEVCYHAKYNAFRTNEKPSALLLTIIDQIQLATNHNEKIMAEVCNPKYFKISSKRTRREANPEPQKTSNDLSEFDISEFANIQQLHRAIMLNEAKIEKPTSNVRLEDIANVNRYDTVNKQQLVPMNLRNPPILQNPYNMPIFLPNYEPLSNGLRSGPPNSPFSPNTQGKYPAMNGFGQKPPQQNKKPSGDDELKGVEIVASPGPPDGYPGGFPGNNPGGFPGGFPTGYPGNFPTEYPGGFPAEYPGSFPSEYPGGFPAEYPGSFSTEYPGSFPAEYPASYPGGYPDHFPQDFYPVLGDAFSSGSLPVNQFGNYYPGGYQPQNTFPNQLPVQSPPDFGFNGISPFYPFLNSGPTGYPVAQYPYPLPGQHIPNQQNHFGLSQQSFITQQPSYGQITSQSPTFGQAPGQFGSEHAPPYVPKPSTTAPAKVPQTNVDKPKISNRFLIN